MHIFDAHLLSELQSNDLINEQVNYEANTLIGTGAVRYKS